MTRSRLKSNHSLELPRTKSPLEGTKNVHSLSFDAASTEWNWKLKQAKPTRRTGMHAPASPALPGLTPLEMESVDLRRLISTHPEDTRQSVTLKVMAHSNRDVFLANDENGRYFVFSTFPEPNIVLGDVLSHPKWEDNEGLWLTALNVTQNKCVRLFLDKGSMSLLAACDLLGNIGAPSRITTLE